MNRFFVTYKDPQNPSICRRIYEQTLEAIGKHISELREVAPSLEFIICQETVISRRHF